jgi:hypothetical protein
VPDVANQPVAGKAEEVGVVGYVGRRERRQALAERDRRRRTRLIMYDD